MIYPIIVGAVQGVAEFLPISSSAHLIIVSALLEGQAMPLEINVSLHIGTLVAVCLYFYKDWQKLTSDLLKPWTKKTPVPKESQKLATIIILGSIPAGIIGILFESFIKNNLHQVSVTLIPLALVGILLWLVDRYAPRNKNITEISPKDALLIGLCQAAALLPGVSRSGSTIIGGRLVGVEKNDAAKFSFLLGTPIMFAAALKSLPELSHASSHMGFYVGIISSCLVGIFSIKFLMNFLKRFSFLGFAIYRCALALVLYLWFV